MCNLDACRVGQVLNDLVEVPIIAFYGRIEKLVPFQKN